MTEDGRREKVLKNGRFGRTGTGNHSQDDRWKALPDDILAQVRRPGRFSIISRELDVLHQCELTRSWDVRIGKKQVRLSPHRDEVFRLYDELMNRNLGHVPITPAASLVASSRLVVEILDAFLDWCCLNKAARSHEHDRENIQKFAIQVPAAHSVACPAGTRLVRGDNDHDLPVVSQKDQREVTIPVDPLRVDPFAHSSRDGAG